MSPFGDEDLKRLKEYIHVRKDLSRDVPVHPEIASFLVEVEALLARLEAAEKTVDSWERLKSPIHTMACYNEWCKTAGKE